MSAIGHVFGAWVSRVPWLKFCRRCGLIALKNERTEKAIRAGCGADE
jgi:hypothetical protein